MQAGLQQQTGQRVLNEQTIRAELLKLQIERERLCREQEENIKKVLQTPLILYCTFIKKIYLK